MTLFRSRSGGPAEAGPVAAPGNLAAASRRLALGGLALAALLGLACGQRKSKAPDWVVSAPAATVMAVSGQAGWVLEQPRFQSLLERFPLAEQTLELFLKRARISPHQETGRVTFYVLSGAPLLGQAGTKPEPSDFLIQLGGFRDSAALHVAIADAFPLEGSLPVAGREQPLYVLMDYNQYHVRAMTDAEGRIWLGDLAALTKLGGARMAVVNAVTQAAQWINGGAPFQGFLRPPGMLLEASGKLPTEVAKNLPQGIEALAWSVTPAASGSPDSSHRFELGITGSSAGVLQVAPWLQRFVAAASALQGGSGPAPEILQEQRRIGLRAQFSQDQVNIALAKLSQPGIRFKLPAPAARP